MTLVKTKPNGSLPKLINDFFETNLFATPRLFDFGTNNLAMSVMPSANITETNAEYKIELAAPGFEKKDFKVEVENRTLTVSSKKEKEEREEKENYRRREFSYQSFSRSFGLPENSLPEKIEAQYDNGILKLTLPKKEVTLSKPKKEIKVG